MPLSVIEEELQFKVEVHRDLRVNGDPPEDEEWQ